MIRLLERQWWTYPDDDGVRQQLSCRRHLFRSGNWRSLLPTTVIKLTSTTASTATCTSGSTATTYKKLFVSGRARSLQHLRPPPPRTPPPRVPSRSNCHSVLHSSTDLPRPPRSPPKWDKRTEWKDIENDVSWTYLVRHGTHHDHRRLEETILLAFDTLINSLPLPRPPPRPPRKSITNEFFFWSSSKGVLYSTWATRLH